LPPVPNPDRPHSAPPRVVQAYGRMILTDGYFQADGHPGNVLVMPGGVVGLIDYGQAKVLTDAQRIAVAAMIVALGQKDSSRVVGAMDDMGIVCKHRGDKNCDSQVTPPLEEYPGARTSTFGSSPREGG
jgi:predicted unusual protein kinase regulating ubiquinone biosynthesis (AarF/ABC1/UbiB family)